MAPSRQHGLPVTNGVTTSSPHANQQVAHVTNGGVFTISGQLDRESRGGNEAAGKRRRSRKAMLAAGIFTLLALVAAVAGAVFGLGLAGGDAVRAEALSDSSTSLPPPPCHNEQCNHVSRLFHAALSSKYDACQNFHQHVCTRWKLSPTSKLTSVINQQKKMIADSVISTLRNTTVPVNGQTAVEKAAGLFQSCTDLEENESSSNQQPKADILAFLQSRRAPFEPESDVDPARLMLDFSLNYGLPTLFDARVGGLPDNAERLYLVLSMRRSFVHRTPAGERAVREHLEWLGLDEARVHQLAPIIKTVDQFLIRLGESAVNDDAADNNNRTLRLLRTLEKAILMKKGELWNSYMRDVTEGLLPAEHYVVFQTRYLMTFLAQVFRKIEANHLRIWMSFDVSRQLRQMFRVSSSGSFHVNSPAYQWDLRCLKLTTQVMHKAAYSAYYHRVVTEQVVSKAGEMLSSIASSLEKKIEQSAWVEDGTKQIAIRKLVGMRKIVGYPEGAKDSDSLNSFYASFRDSGSSLVRNWLNASRSNMRKALEGMMEQPTTLFVNEDMSLVNAIYKPPLNTMVMGLGLLLPPFFGTIAAVDYASAGHLAAHEMMHAFDVANSRRDDNNVQRDWWTEASKREYDERVKCIRNSHLPLEGDSAGPDDVTDSEIMADFIGLSGLYEAYLTAKQQAGSPQGLQELPGLSSDQLFFVAFCFKWCSNARPTERYPEYEVRCNMPLMNMPEFSTAFNCSAESPMNPTKKCVFW